MSNQRGCLNLFGLIKTNAPVVPTFENKPTPPIQPTPQSTPEPTKQTPIRQRLARAQAHQNTSPTIDNKAPTNLFPLGTRISILSKTEIEFYRALQSAVGDRAIIMCKVRLFDVFYIKQPRINFKFANRIIQKHVDFLICQPQTLKPIAGIELNDRSHLRQDRQERDALVMLIFKSAGLPLINLTPKPSYNPTEIQNLLPTLP